MTESVWEELKSSGSHVHISVLCPGPVSTEFNRVANVNFGIPGLKSREVAEYAAACMFSGKRVIIPGILAKAAHIVSGIIPEKILMKSVYGFRRLSLAVIITNKNIWRMNMKVNRLSEMLNGNVSGKRNCYWKIRGWLLCCNCIFYYGQSENSRNRVL